tara:strand:- start:4534 stop:5373 length:840 start_codon:yes stop_codon:yes gene_type:complete
MDTQIHAKTREANSLWFWIISIIMISVGVCLLLLPQIKKIEDIVWLSSLMRSIGGTLVGVAIVSFLWELMAKRKFAEELFTIADISASVKRAGILEVSRAFLKLPWPQLFKESNSLQLFISYGRTWRNTYRPNIIDFMSTSKKKLSLYLPDPDDDLTINELARRFRIDPSEIKKRISESISDFEDMCTEAGGKASSRLRIYRISGIAPTSTYYLFDNVAIITTYPHSKTRQPAPVFLIGKGGDMYTFVEEEFDAIRQMESIPMNHESDDELLRNEGDVS